MKKGLLIGLAALLFVTLSGFILTDWYTCKTCNGTGKYVMEDPCRACNGTGSYSTPKRCSTCNYTGKVRDSYGDQIECPTCHGERVTMEPQRCHVCEGKGVKTTKCPTCFGKGKVYIEE